MLMNGSWASRSPSVNVLTTGAAPWGGQGQVPRVQRQTLLKPHKRGLVGSFFLAAALGAETAFLIGSAQAPGERRSSP